MDVKESDAAALAPAAYCREVERYLCRRNAGHLIRIVGPAFETVTGWARRGIPIKVAYRGIDRTVERDAGKGPRRRPVRIEFCEADVLDAFDDWRRAVGAEIGPLAPDGAAGEGGEGEPAAGAAEEGSTKPRRVPLQAHIDRVMSLLTQRRLDAVLHEALAAAIDRALPALDGLRNDAHGARGAKRASVQARLQEIEAWLDAGARSAAPAELARAEVEARRDLQPFRSRMPDAAFADAVRRETSRQLRAAMKLPEIVPVL